MNEKGEAAIEACSTLIANGVDGAEVYYQLSAQLHQLGRTEQALTRVNEGLSLHRNNSLLTILLENLQIDTEEQVALRASAERNKFAMNRGKLKITCLTKTTSAGLDACRGYLAQTNVDGERIKDRANEIVTALAITSPTNATSTSSTDIVDTSSRNSNSPDSLPDSTQALTTPQPATVDSSQPISNVGIASSQAQPEKINNAQAVQRELVRSIQAELSSLGYDVGVPDGISGPRTRTAVAQFYQRTQNIVNDKIGDQTLTDVRNAAIAKESAISMLADSRQAEAKQDIEKAISLLASAEQTSSLFTVPSGYRENLYQQLSQLNQVPQENQHTAVSSSAPGTTDSAELALSSQTTSPLLETEEATRTQASSLSTSQETSQNTPNLVDGTQTASNATSDNLTLMQATPQTAPVSETSTQTNSVSNVEIAKRTQEGIPAATEIETKPLTASPTYSEESRASVVTDIDPALMQQISSLAASLSLRRTNNRRQNQAMRTAIDELFK